MKPEYLLLAAVLLIVAVAIYAAFNPQVEKENEEGKEKEGEATQEELASEIEKGNAQLKESETTTEKLTTPEFENITENSTNENPIRIQAK